mgnify:CR=1 FL=1
MSATTATVVPSQSPDLLRTIVAAHAPDRARRGGCASRSAPSSCAPPRRRPPDGDLRRRSARHGIGST